jgi:hypothetical protein
LRRGLGTVIDSVGRGARLHMIRGCPTAVPVTLGMI